MDGENIAGLKIFRANARSAISLPKKLAIDGELEIHCGPFATIDIRNLAVKGSGQKIIIGERSVVRGARIGISGEGCILKIGARFKCGPVQFMLQRKSITIGDGVLFSQNIVVRTSDMHSIIDIESTETINPPQDIVIGDRVWIMQDCLILKGSHIGNDCAIGHRRPLNGARADPPNTIAKRPEISGSAVGK